MAYYKTSNRTRKHLITNIKRKTSTDYRKIAKIKRIKDEINRLQFEKNRLDRETTNSNKLKEAYASLMLMQKQFSQKMK